MIRAGLGQLGWSPEVFWAATLREVQLALAGHLGLEAGAPPMGRDALLRLQVQFPDVEDPTGG